MSWMLAEKNPRQWTPGYGLHRFRAVMRTQAGWLLPTAACLGYGLGGAIAVVSSGALPKPANALDALLPAATLVAASGLPAALGTSALWRWISARLYPWLDSHPLPDWLIERDYRLPTRQELDEPAIIIGEVHPEREYSASGEYTLRRTVAEQYSITPEWSVIPWRSLVTGLLVLGATGSGKTSFVLRPSVFKLFHHHTQPGGLVMDTKASLVEPLLAEMELAGRSADLLRVGPDQPTRWNPLHMPLSSPATISDALLTCVENVNGAPYSSESRWIRNGAAHLVEGAIGLLRLTANYVTASAVREFLSLLMSLTAGSDTPGEAVSDGLKTMFASSTAPTDRKEEYDHYSGLLISRMSEDEKFRAIYISELLSLLVPLTSPFASQKFNAAEADLDMPGWVEAINRGLVVSLDCNSRVAPGLSVVLGMLLKLGFQDAMLARLDWVRKGLCNSDRFMVLCVDEYQTLCSPGDADYLALCRESKAITVFLTQGFPSIQQRLGEDRSKVILQSLRNRLILTQDPAEFAADMLGKHEIEQIDRNISESMQDASLHATGKFAGQSSVSESLSMRKQEKHVITALELAKLPTGQGILQSHDGYRTVETHRVFLRPYFAQDTRHVDFERSKNA